MNEPEMRGPSHAPPPAKSVAATAVLLLAGLFVLGGAAVAGVGYWRYAHSTATATATGTETGPEAIPTVTLTTARPVDEVDAALAPLHGPVGTVRTSTATATATSGAKACKAKSLKGGPSAHYMTKSDILLRPRR